MKFYDAHNHLQDDRFGGRQGELLAACEKAGVARMVVNGACESDWPQVLALARENQIVLPSFGYHPWYLRERTPDWLKNLEKFLDEIPSAVGEIGLDRWKPDLPYDDQEEVFLAQLAMAAERNLPASIHCLQAWGRLHELLRDSPRPARGLVLHSFGGPAEMIPAFAKLGAYFSFPAIFCTNENCASAKLSKKFRRTGCWWKPTRPTSFCRRRKFCIRSPDADGKPLNHPANLAAVYAGLAEFLGEKTESLAARVEENFLRVFGR